MMTDIMGGLVKKNVGLIHAVAQSFNRTTGLDTDDLVGEASLKFCEAMVKRYDYQFDPKRSSFSTWITMKMQQRLTQVVAERKEIRENEQLAEPRLDEDGNETVEYTEGIVEITPEQLVDFKERLERCTADAKEVIQMVLEAPAEFLSLTASRKARGKLKDTLREKGWTWWRIWGVFDELKEVVEGRE